MIETPLGVLNANEIAAASDNVVCLIVGTSDLTNDLRARHTKRREPMLTSLSMCILAGRANGGTIYFSSCCCCYIFWILFAVGRNDQSLFLFFFD